MPAIQAEVQLSPEQILEAVGQLSPEEIESFTQRLLELRARRVAPVVSADESPLLERINNALPPAKRARYAELLSRRDAATLTEAEHAQLLDLSDAVELLDAERLAALAELARLRGVRLADLIASLGTKR